MFRLLYYGFVSQVSAVAAGFSCPLWVTEMLLHSASSLLIFSRWQPVFTSPLKVDWCVGERTAASSWSLLHRRPLSSYYRENICSGEVRGDNCRKGMSRNLHEHPQDLRQDKIDKIRATYLTVFFTDCFGSVKIIICTKDFIRNLWYYGHIFGPIGTSVRTVAFSSYFKYEWPVFVIYCWAIN